jgi:hypothetical protein
MNERTHGRAAAHFEQALKQWGDPQTFMLAARDPLPDSELSWWRLHPGEVEMFGIDVSLYPRLLEAFSWYSGAVLGNAHNDYHEYWAEEQQRWSRFVVMRGDEAVFDRASCQSFMHKAAGLPLRQCEAMIQKMAACELRSCTLVFRDETDDEDWR